VGDKIKFVPVVKGSKAGMVKPKVNRSEASESSVNCAVPRVIVCRPHNGCSMGLSFYSTRTTLRMTR